jgi:Holliday junction DNA helicase RuvA
MLGYLRGQVLDNGISSGDGKIILGVGSEAHGFTGYSVNVPKNTHYELLPHGKSIELFIYTHVREDQLDLYGFATRTEKEMFLTLLSVNGIGPKGALGILSNTDVNQLIQAVMDEDTALLTKIPGIGKKTAERVVLELAEPLRKKAPAAGATARDSSAPGSGIVSRSSSQEGRDAVSALVGLGFREADVASVVSRVIAESAQPPRTEDLIKTVLRQLG